VEELQKELERYKQMVQSTTATDVNIV